MQPSRTVSTRRSSPSQRMPLRKLPTGTTSRRISSEGQAVANVVHVLVDGRLERARPHGRGYRYAASDGGRVHGVMIDMRYMPRERPRELSPGETIDITSADVEAALAKVRPVEVHKSACLQVLRCIVDKSAGAAVLDPESLITVQDPGILIGDINETFGQWMDRVYDVHMGQKKEYLRSLVLRIASLGYVLARGCRPCGPGAGLNWKIRADSFENLD